MITFCKPRQIVEQKRCYVRQGEFQAGHQTKFFLEKMRTPGVYVALKTMCSSCTLKNIKLPQAHVHQHPKEPQ